VGGVSQGQTGVRAQPKKGPIGEGKKEYTTLGGKKNQKKKIK